MNLFGFTTFILILSLMFIQFFASFQRHYSGVRPLRAQVSMLQDQLKQEQLQALINKREAEDIEQSVATLLPSAIHKAHNPWMNYSLRNLASVVDTPQAPLQIQSAHSLFLQARSAFRHSHYHSSDRLFSQLIELYPTSSHVVEAHFLLSEGRYLTHNPAGAVKTIRLMMARFPENVLTGYALLRLAEIDKQNDRIYDAGQVLRVIRTRYKDPVLDEQAAKELKDLNL